MASHEPVCLLFIVAPGAGSRTQFGQKILPIGSTQPDATPASDVPHTTLPLNAADTSGDEPPSHDGTKREGQAKRVAWAGVKTAFSVLEASADAFASLKSAIGGLDQCIEICEKASKAREDYDKPEEEINDLIATEDGFEDGLAENTRTASIRSLSRGAGDSEEETREKYDRATSRSARRPGRHHGMLSADRGTHQPTDEALTSTRI
ncbi:hypothetical protein B0J17DRAFT_724149 [Rhizoctonia solani]|nr:hypothetical protein B0J17DRAFT_724149 [Rhizoctonia solani]